MTALILAVSCLLSLSLLPWLAEYWPMLSPLELLTKSRWEDGLWSDNIVVFIQFGRTFRISLIPTSIAWLTWKRRSRELSHSKPIFSVWEYKGSTGCLF